MSDIRIDSPPMFVFCLVWPNVLNLAAILSYLHVQTVNRVKMAVRKYSGSNVGIEVPDCFSFYFPANGRKCARQQFCQTICRRIDRKPSTKLMMSSTNNHRKVPLRPQDTRANGRRYAATILPNDLSQDRLQAIHRINDVFDE